MALQLQTANKVKGNCHPNLVTPLLLRLEAA
eukprot:CAMPEP_0206375650 /NCGR_PEP_ID=MMETSP0294-20121207/8999_1 /ASSEMBLY_ACC=CAM_ASM_000327 /TAXON_ID=39354 /ORGANISM="Heterosigma akashiwo, Strain CCMP2393" /LENGTH=30 /DNA_ID= /DNA_START= /DNA_END= /DNA_ORIENTATION=